MVDFATTVIGVIGATFIPVYISLYLITNLKFLHLRYIAAAGLGLAMFFFFDTLNDAAQLDVNSSFSGGLPQFGLVLAFILGVATLAAFDHFAVPPSIASNGKPSTSKTLFLIPAAIAVVMGIHGLAEGWAFGSSAAGTGSQSLIDAFGGLSPLASYPMHKFLEAGVVAATYSAYIARSGKGGARWQIPVLGVLFALPPTIGASLGYYINVDPTYFYAFGVTAAIYAVLRLVEPIKLDFKIGEKSPMYIGTRVFVAVLIGFLLLYGAALFH